MGVLACSVLSFKGNLAGRTPCLHDYKLLIEPPMANLKKTEKSLRPFPFESRKGAVPNTGSFIIQYLTNVTYMSGWLYNSPRFCLCRPRRTGLGRKMIVIWETQGGQLLSTGIPLFFWSSSVKSSHSFQSTFSINFPQLQEVKNIKISQFLTCYFST
jgi:hypothetical protein